MLGSGQPASVLGRAIAWVAAERALLDLRTAEAYESAHLKGSSSLPCSLLLVRMHEIPPRGTEVGLLGEVREEVAEAQKVLVDRGYLVSDEACFVTDELTLPPPPPSSSCGCDHGHADHHQDTNKKSHDLLSSPWVETGASSVRLWIPSPLLNRETDRIESLLASTSAAQGERVWRALDIGCGSGRDAVFLALRGWEVLGVDYLDHQIEKLHGFAQQHGVADRVKGACMDVEKNNGQELLEAYPEHFDLVSVARFLHRPLIPDVLAKLTKPGGMVAYHTFMKGSEQFGRPRSPKHLLLPGELADNFTRIGWEVIVDSTVAIKND